MKDKNTEILQLAEEVLKNIELNEIPLRNVALKCSRLARFTNNQRAMDLFNYELAGYPQDEKGYILAEAFHLARHANRTFQQKDQTGKSLEYMFPQTVAELESAVDAAREQLKVAFDTDVSVSSSNPYQHVVTPFGNTIERAGLRQIITDNSKKIDQLKVAYYRYVLGVYYELKFGNISEDIFSKKRGFVDKVLSEKLLEAIKKFVSIYENLRSKNEEDWANAVHSCRRLLSDIADYLYPPSDESIAIGKDKTIKLDTGNYIARLKQYIKNKTESERFIEIVGSHLDYIGDRVDSIYNASSKGTHAKVTKEEAERYVIYTYLLLSDILDL